MERIKCKRCRIIFEKPDLCFYDLCKHCFNLFDNQKMKGRFENGFEGGEENSDLWVKAFPFKKEEKSESNYMDEIYNKIDETIKKQKSEV